MALFGHCSLVVGIGAAALDAALQDLLLLLALPPLALEGLGPGETRPQGMSSCFHLVNVIWLVDDCRVEETGLDAF